MRHFIAITIFSLGFLSSIGQIIVDNSINENTAVNDILLGSGVTASNIQFSGEGHQIGSFDANGSIMTIASGVVIATGNCNMVSASADDDPGPGGNTQGGMTAGGGNWDPTDSDLEVLSGQDLHDAAILEFDFIPQGDSIKFNFVFASEEYNEWVNSGFNDAFGFFLSGPGINGTFSNNAINLAVVPGTNTAISINTINNNSNSEFYVDNEAMSADPNVIEHDGFTISLLAEALVQCGEEYHIKMVIADGGDTALDSAVFLEASSFSSNLVEVELMNEIGFLANDSTVYEGCNGPVMIFSRPPDQNDEQTIFLTLSGTATDGEDFDGLPEEIFFAEGVSELEFPISFFEDNLDEDLEFVTITYEGVSECSGQTLTDEITIYITDVTPIEVQTEDTTSDCGESVTLEPIITGGVGEYTINWNDGNTDLVREVTPGTTTTYQFTVTDECNTSIETGEITVDVPIYPELVLDQIPAQNLTCGDEVTLTAEASGGNDVFTYDWTEGDENISSDATITYTINSSSVLTVTATDGCGTETSQDIEFILTPIFVTLPNDSIIECLTDIEVIPSIEPVDVYQYAWESENVGLSTETTLLLEDMNSDMTVALTIANICGQEASDEMEISILETPVFLSLTDDQYICLNESADLTASATGGVGELFYNWTDLSHTDSVLSVTPIETSTYEVTASDMCGNTASSSVLVQVEDLQAGFVYEQINDHEIEFLNTTNEPASLIWDFGGYSTSNEENPTFYNPNLYDALIVTLHATSEAGCTDSLSHIFLPQPLIYVPNAFTPNNDGVNDVFEVRGDFINSFGILIFNRFGELVYESKDLNEVWNGSHLNGEYYVPNGVYNYIISYHGLDTGALSFKGHVTVFR